MHKFQRPAYIADGFEDDCEELIRRCSQVKTLSYEKFCQVWKEMDFITIYHGRNASSEIAELSEEVLHIAKRYMVCSTSNYEENVAGLFIVYALINLQPLHGFASLRLIPDDVSAILRMERLARQSRRYDVLYILGSVLIKGPCQFHVVQRERGMERALKKYFESYSPVDENGLKPRGVFYRRTEESDLLKELDRLGKLYKDAKKALVGPNSNEKSLNYVNEDLMRQLDVSLKKVVLGLQDDSSDSDASVIATHEENPQSIKERAMRSTVKGLRHLTGIEDRRSPRGSMTRVPNPETMKIAMSKQIATMFAVRGNSDDEDELNQSLSLPELDAVAGPSGSQNQPEKQKINNTIRAQTKLAKNAMKRKRQNELKRPGRKRKASVNISDSDEDLETNDDQDDKQNDDQDTNDKQNDDQATNDNQNSYIELDIDSVPIVIDNEAPSMEVEFIDLRKDNKTKVVKKLRKNLKVKSKRELKKTRIKGMFHRLGMPTIANFENKNDIENCEGQCE